MRRSIVRLILFGWLFITFLVSLRLFSSTNSPSEQRRDAPEDPVLRFQAGPRVATPPWPKPPKDGGRPPSTTPVSEPKRRPDPVQERRQLIRNFKAQLHTSNRTGWDDYFRFRNTGSDRIWPEQGEMEDRILNQIHLVHSDPAGRLLGSNVSHHHVVSWRIAESLLHLSDSSSDNKILFSPWSYSGEFRVQHRPDPK